MVNIKKKYFNEFKCKITHPKIGVKTIFSSTQCLPQENKNNKTNKQTNKQHV